MKIPIIDFTIENLNTLKSQNEWNDHFNLILWPRLLFWLGLKEHFSDYKALDWKIHYTPENMHNNFISMHIRDDNDRFNFYFQVPLVQKLSFNLYLGDNTYNFFEAHPMLISKGVIKKEEYKIGATSSILPHLVLSNTNHRYSQHCLRKINEVEYINLTKNDPLINLLIQNFKKFIPPLDKIIKGEWIL